MSYLVYILIKYIKKRIALAHENRRQRLEQASFPNRHGVSEERSVILDSPLFNFETVSAATSNFSDANKLGQGGFGSVYMGKLGDGREIAVKRLSTKSNQGLEEFRNEVELISKLQHKNLVKLLGCCADSHEKILLYEFMPNKSLDFFLFDMNKRGILDWNRRYNIIQGVARGLLYLHRDSRVKIIHRDLKAGNVLLDELFYPKISDFGMARIFGEDQIQETRRVVGTIGYMSPEYAMEGKISEKLDVFSFGVLILEIISGKRNNNFLDDNQSLNLVGHAWILWKENRALELIDASLMAEDQDVDKDQVLKCIKVGLLCVQEYPKDRPNMSFVVSMLSNDIIIPSPKPAAFFGGRGGGSSSYSFSTEISNEIITDDDLTLTT
ncbi:hypothetical protein LUZ60_009142 [Juncus effusus]|nr:hypothetical protein LUZ60_009142 [Juncus effusus]